MKLSRKNKKLEQKRIVDLTPMIDVIFLLVIFFMTSSTLIQIKSLKIDLPKAASSDKDINQPSILSINEEGKYFINGKDVKLESIAAALKSEMEKKEIKVLLVEGYKNLPYQKIIEVMSLAKEAGIEKVSLAVQN